MSKNITELCTLLVEKEHGELAADVFSTVAHVGRQHLTGLIRVSNLSAKHFRHGLATLLQHQLVLHAQVDDVAFYEVSWGYTHNLARTGKITKLVEMRFGKNAAEIITDVLISGHAKVSDLTAAYKLNNKKAEASTGANTKGPALQNGTVIKYHDLGRESNGVEAVARVESNNDDEASNIDSTGNGGQVGSIKPPYSGKSGLSETLTNGSGNAIKPGAQLHSIIYRLLKSGWIVPVDKRDFWPASDQRLEAEEHVIDTHFEKGKPPKGPKQIKLLNTHLKQRMRQLRDRPFDIPSAWTQTGSKRSASDAALPPSKRARANGVNGSYHNSLGEDDSIMLDDNLVVRINPEKVSVAMRTEQLVLLARRFIGETTAKVYRAFLQLLEEQTPRCHDEFKPDPDPNPDNPKPLVIESQASCMQIAEALDSDVDLHDGLADTTDGVNGSTEHLRNRGKLVEHHIKILSEDPRHFVTWASNRGLSEWYADFPRLSRHLIQNQIEETVQSRYERLGMRLIRVLYNKGKLDEKQVATYSMSLPKITRPLLSQMQEAGFLDLQEIPKDNSRHPSRTIFLWFYDQDRVKRLLLEDAYKVMARILQRIDVERDKIREVIEKAERTDVKGKEEKFLTKQERQALREYSQTETKLSLQLERVDDLVGILKDFLGPI